MQPRRRPETAVLLAMVGSVCATLIAHGLNTSPTVRLIGAALAAAVTALIAAGGRHLFLGIGVTIVALVITYTGFTAFDYATDRPKTFPLPPSAPNPEQKDGQVTTGGVVLPDVGGALYMDAVATLEQAGLRAEREDVETNEPPDTVVDEDPAAGTRVEKGTTVTLSVSRSGPVVVPGVVGSSESDASAELEKRFKVEVRTSPVSDPSQDHVVLDQFPDADVQATPGDTVTLTVGTFVTPSGG
jgi:hypothetical protein